MRAWLYYIGAAIAGLIVFIVVAILVLQRVSDGPIEFLQGGPFQTGEIVEEPVSDWSFGVDRPTQFELVGYGTSRTAGYILHDGVAYMTCDLGFIWNRLDGSTRYILNLIYIFKTWHLNAVEDGRALLRIDGNIYKVQFTRIEDPELEAALRNKLELLAVKAMGQLGPEPDGGPNDIWFFRIDSRS